MNITTNREYRWRPTTDEFTVRVIRELTEQEIDPEVGPMYEVVAHAYVDELSLPQPTGTGLLGEVIEILYPLDGFRDDQWNGGDVCEALAAVIDKYAPWAKTRQPERDDEPDEAKRFCMETLWQDDDVRLLCCLPLGHEGDHEAMTPPESGFEAFRRVREERGL